MPYYSLKCTYKLLLFSFIASFRCVLPLCSIYCNRIHVGSRVGSPHTFLFTRMSQVSFKLAHWCQRRRFFLIVYRWLMFKSGELKKKSDLSKCFSICFHSYCFFAWGSCWQSWNSISHQHFWTSCKKNTKLHVYYRIMYILC